MSKIKLMIVDDHDMIREGLYSMLSSCNDLILVDSCSSGEEAVDASLKSKPDVILMDIKMEKVNGIETTKKIISKIPEIKVIFLTVFDDSESIRQALQAGGVGYVLKHVSREKLIQCIKRAYQGETIIEETIFNKIVNNYTQQDHGVTGEEKLKENFKLTPREHEVLYYLTKGFTNKEISNASHLAVDTVKTHLRNIFRKMGVQNRSQAITKAIELDFQPVDENN